MIHPEIACKFADSCTRMNCAYKHTGKRNMSSMMNPMMMMMAAMTGSGGKGFNFNGGYAGKKDAAGATDAAATPTASAAEPQTPSAAVETQG